MWTNREDRRCAGTLPCDTVSVVQIPGFRSLTRHGSSVLGSEPACHVLQIADSMRSAAIGVCDLRSVCATELEAYIGDCTCNLRNSVAARWPCQIFSFGIYFQLSNLQNCQFVTEDILWLLHSRQIGFCHQEKECPAQQRAWLLSKGDLNPIKEPSRQ